MTRTQIAAALTILAKMVRDGDETTVEIDQARRALDSLRGMENFSNRPAHTCVDRPNLPCDACEVPVAR